MTSAQIDTIQALEAENNRLNGEIKAKEELIPGMEKMIAYMNKIQEENKKLKEENKELKEAQEEEDEDSVDLINDLEEDRDTEKWLKEKAQHELSVSEKSLQIVKDENKKLKEENKTLEDIHSGDMKIVKMLNEKWNEEQEKNKKLKEYYDKWSPILTDIDGDDFCNLLCDYGWEYNDEFELVRTTDK